MPGVIEIEQYAFYSCTALTDVEFGKKLEIIGRSAFCDCRSLRSVKMPSVRMIEQHAFGYCKQLTDMELPVVERIGVGAFHCCPRLQRIAIPLKDSMFPLDAFDQRCTQFDTCGNLSTVDLVGGIHNTISSFLLESWRDEMDQEIGRINRVLPYTPREKADTIRQWIVSVINRMEHYKSQHNQLLKENMTQVELAVWKAKLDEKEEDNSNVMVQAKKARIDVESARKERRITSGASIVIKNVLPFLQLG